MKIENKYTDRDFEEVGFLNKIKTVSYELALYACELYCVAKHKDCPLKVRAAILAALAYFVSPIDVIPDLIPILGYTDDLAVLTALLETLDQYITPEIRAEAERMLG